MIELQINKLKNKIYNQEKILELNQPVKYEENFLLVEKKIMIFSSIITLFSLFVVFIDFSSLRFSNLFDKNTEYINYNFTSIKNNKVNFGSDYEKLSKSKIFLNISYDKSKNALDQNINKINNISDVSALAREIKILKKEINKIQNENIIIISENENLTSKNFLLEKVSRNKIIKLEESLAALSSKTKIQNQKLSTAISMIDNLKLERVNLLSKLNLINSYQNNLANFE